VFGKKDFSTKYKFKQFLSATYYLLIEFYLEKHTFVRQFNVSSSYFFIQAGVLQGNDLLPHLFNIYTSDMPTGLAQGVGDIGPHT